MEKEGFLNAGCMHAFIELTRPANSPEWYAAIRPRAAQRRAFARRRYEGTSVKGLRTRPHLAAVY